MKLVKSPRGTILQENVCPVVTLAPPTLRVKKLMVIFTEFLTSQSVTLTERCILSGAPLSLSCYISV